jgi:DNA replication licensing factor MCM3
MEYLAAFDGALKNMVESVGHVDERESDITSGKTIYHVGLEGSFGDMQVTPRTLNTRYLGKMIAIEGIVTTCK